MSHEARERAKYVWMPGLELSRTVHSEEEGPDPGYPEEATWIDKVGKATAPIKERKPCERRQPEKKGV